MIKVTPELAALLPSIVYVTKQIRPTYPKILAFHLEDDCRSLGRTPRPTWLSEALDRGLELCVYCAMVVIERQRAARAV